MAMVGVGMEQIGEKVRRWSILWCIAVISCGDSASDGGNIGGFAAGQQSETGGSPAGMGPAIGTGATGAGLTNGAGMPSAASVPDPSGPNVPAGTASVDTPAPAPAGGSTSGAPTPAGMPTMPLPLPEGDPNGSGSVVSIPEIQCGPATNALVEGVAAGLGLPGPGAPNVQIGGRDVVLSYPCNKRVGAHVTFILNLHGTMPDDNLKFYQHGYFAAHRLVDSHSLIVATPRSVVSQWNNDDGGVDIPHLYEVVDWVYSKFSQFKITGLWIGGHSWGSFFAKEFICDEMFRDKALGVIGMSGGASGVGSAGAVIGGSAFGDCAARLSQIHTVGDQEGGESGVPDQTTAAAAHGCDARLPPMDIGNGQMVYRWPNCDPGWTHFNIVMGNHSHITPINPEVVEYIVDAIKAVERR